METKNFRIGNYIGVISSDRNLENKAFRIVAIRKNWVEVELNSVTGKTHEVEKTYIKPLLLTEQWLKKFGFDDHLCKPGFIKKEIDGKMDFIISKPDNLNMITENKYCFPFSQGGLTFINYFNYVHEFQNFFHSMMDGMELLNGQSIGEPEPKPDLKSSAEWIKEYNYRILDTDGWDRENLEYSFHKELISKQEFESRLFKSTIERRK
jgi:hypothetical protein